MTPRELADAFYGAFARRDGDAMAACYAPDAHFHDPAFGDLHGDEPGAMWRMLTARARDLRVEHEVLEASDTHARVKWIAHYTFALTGRPVENHIVARLTVRDGKIVEHLDDFDFWKWSRMALGWKGVLLGWTPLVRNAVRKMARKQLAELGRP